MIGIRAATPDDAAAIAAIYAPYVVSTGVALDATPPSAETMRGRIETSGDSHPWLVAIETESGGVLAYAHATPFRARAAYRWVVETSIYIAGDVGGRGVGRLLYGALIATLKEQGFTQAIAGIGMPNDRMITLHESVGFRRAGVYREVGHVRGQWVDVGFWQCVLAEPDDPPEEPKSCRDVGVVRR
ncbi:MAG: N-acetyltransferase [Sphingomonadaceae bacterium]|nr:N-acetyltransferase [Sphingomonadaceae bacterium]